MVNDASRRAKAAHPRQHGPASGIVRFIGDVVLIAAALALAHVFLGHNGFIGHHDIQPFPY